MWSLIRINCSLCRDVRRAGLVTALSVTASLAATSVYADNGVKFTDIAANNGAGIDYRRTASPSEAIWDALKQQEVLLLEDTVMIPGKSRGAPGVALFDFDLDGDVDIYVTNGPGSANSLYSSQLSETGELRYVDVGSEVGVAATEQDSTGVCFGDIDNDGDQDLLVLGNGMPNRLFENRIHAQDGGKGMAIFAEITALSRLGETIRHPASCAMGDVNGDGLLDIAVANTYNNWEHRLPLATFDHDVLMEHNQLFLNQGNNVFDDASEHSGIQTVARVTWALALVDYDIDGDADLIVADDQGLRAPAKYGGVDYGYLRIFNNDGAGHFTELTRSLGMEQFGAWMGLAFGDLNSDGHMDMFATNVGDYASIFGAPLFNYEGVIGEWASNWFFGDEHGGFSRAGAGELVTTPFGWGASMADYDNDSDLDIIFHGGLDAGTFGDASNPGAILSNNGAGQFSRDTDALINSSDHLRRNVHGLAVSDLNNDGFVDIVSVSNQDWPESFPLVPFLPYSLGGAFDDTAFIWPVFNPVDPNDFRQGFVWSGLQSVDGTLSVEINGGENTNRWVKVNAVGTVGLTASGRVNRDGIGAIVSFRPDVRNGDSRSVMRPLLGGSSYASQESLEVHFGLGRARSGTIDILWPGGVRNRLYNVRANEAIVFPEIPCSIDDRSVKITEYRRCVDGALRDFVNQGVLDQRLKGRYLNSALRAFGDEREG